MNNKINYRASETEIIRPFNIVEGYFSDVSFSISDKDGFSLNDRFYQENTKEIEQIKIKFKFNNQDTNHFFNTKENFKISIIFKDKILKTNFHIGEYDLIDLDDQTVNIREKIPFSLSESNFEISLILKEKNSFKILAQKRFIVTKEVNTIEIPKMWVESDYFVDLGLSEKTIWFVKWLGSDLEKDLNELLIVCFNKNYELMIDRMSSSKDKSFQIQMMSSIWMDIIYPILSKNKEYEDGYAKALDHVKDFLVKNLMVTKEKLNELIDDENFHSFLSTSIVNLNKLDNELIKFND